MSKFKCAFQDDWKNKFSWICEVDGNKYMAYCKLCKSKFNLSNMGLTAVNSHRKGKKHILNENNAASSSTIGSFFKSPQCLLAANIIPAVKTAEGQALTEEASIPSGSGSIQVTSVEPPSNKSINKYMLKEQVTASEIMWCLQAIASHKSLRSAETDVKVFPTLFPDSEIAKSMQLGRNKMAYLIVHGISPFCQKSLLDEVVTLGHFVIGFDESLNKVSQKQQMDLNIRFWDNKNEVKTRYFTSVFLERTRASDLLTGFIKALEPLEVKKLLQVSMDGPNVNKAFFKDLKEFVKTDPDSPEILNLGSCGLHAVNVAFKKGAVSSGWNIFEFNRALYYLFKDSPARRALYTEHTGSEIFPKKFCSVRWLENCDVANRSTEMIPNMKIFILALEKEKNTPTSKSYEIVKNAVKDKFLPAKLYFFCTVASEMESFLKEYQSDIPLIPFLYTDLYLLMRGLMERFITEEALVNNEIMDINITDEKNLLPVNQIDIGVAAISSLKKIPSKTNQELYLFRKECRVFLQECVKKMRERSPLIYPLAKAVTCFDPAVVLRGNLFSNRLSNLLLILTDKKWIDGFTADRAKKQLKHVCSKPEIKQLCQEYERHKDKKNLNEKETRIDKFWFGILSTENNCKDALIILKISMILSHGNANLERGFSINSDCLWDNMLHESLVARRTVYDHIVANGGVSNICITKQMILYARNARSKFEEAMKLKQNEKKVKTTELLRKREAAFHLKELEAKKAKILQAAKTEIDSLDEEIVALRKLQK